MARGKPKRPRESAVSNDVKKHLRVRGWWVFKVVASEQQESGIPDLLCAFSGKLVGIEMKVIDTPRCKLAYTDKQQVQLDRLLSSGCGAYGLAYAWKTDSWVLHSRGGEMHVFEKLDRAATFMENLT